MLPKWTLKGVETIGVAIGQKFNMRAIVLWTINDFSARSSLSGWSRQGYKACLTCNEDTPSQYLPDEVAKPTIELCSFFKQICSATLMEDDMLKAQSKVVDILCNLELIYPPAFFDIMIHLVIHLPLEALEGEPICPRWMFPFERFIKKLKDNDPGISITSELFALACGPTPTPISVNSCVVNGVRFVVHNRDERRTTQNNGICSPGGKDGEMYYDGQSTKVDTPPNIIDFDEDDDIIDDENDLPHDLADSDDEDLVNVDVDDDDGADDMSTDVAWGHDSDGGGDDRPPTHHIPTGCWGCFANRGKGTRKPNLGERKAGRLHTRQETQSLGLKKITDDKGLGDAFVLPFLEKGLGGAEGGDLDKDWAYWVINPEIETYDVERIRKRRPQNITPADWDAHVAFWNDPRNQARAAQNRQNRAKSIVVYRQGSWSLARLRDQM
nr:hypothetical protein [Tanacetum cinerariifolium]